jgi:hypothetical protein
LVSAHRPILAWREGLTQMVLSSATSLDLIAISGANSRATALV